MTPLEYITTNRESCVKLAQARLPNSLKNDAEDVVQDIALDYLFKSPDDAIDNVESYVRTAVNNRCLQLIRNNKNRRQLLEDNDEQVRANCGYNTVSPDPADVVEAEDNKNNVLNELSDIEHQVLIDILEHGKSYKIVAEKYDISVESARQHVSRIKRKFTNG